ncbi:MAG: TonB family protein [Methylococcales bacterium]|nr:TonB family protein [Methylococcales bacterium]
MSYAVVSTTPAVVTTNRSFLFALVIAVIVHIMLVLGVQIAKPDAEKISRSIDITLVNSPSVQAPEKTELLAQDNQIGSGEKIAKPEPVKQQPAPTNTPVKPMPKNLMEKITPPPQVKPALKQPEKIKPLPVPKPEPVAKPIEKPIDIPPPAPKPIAKPVEKLIPAPPHEQVFKADAMPSKPDVTQKVLTQEKAEQKIATRTHTTLSKGQPETHHLSAASLQQQISEQAVATTQQAVAAPQIKTKSVNQVSANKYVAAQYLHDWEAKVAGVGNHNYPEAATKPGFSATLTMDVGIDIDGNIDSIRITHSSGNPELDEAAKKIVRMSAPFPPLPMALRNELDILKITRVWKFTDESGLVTQ